MVTKSSANTPTGTTGTVLQGQGAGVDLALSTATYPSTTTVSQILYSSATNVVGEITTANNGVLITSNTGVPSLLAAGTTGQVLTATTGAPASWATNTSTDYHDSIYIVGASASANYATIALGYAAAVLAGAPATVFLQPGTYTENLTLVAGINLCAHGCDSSLNATGNVKIVGKLTMTTAGSVTISGIELKTNGAEFLAVTGSAASNVNLNNCYLYCLNATGIIYSSSSGSSKIKILNCTANIGTTGITLYTSTGSGSFQIDNTIVRNDGGSSTPITSSVSNCSFNYCQLHIPVSMTGTAVASFVFTAFINLGNVTAFTTAGTGSDHHAYASDFRGATATAVSIGSGTTFKMYGGTIESTNASVVAGAGTFRYSGVTFVDTGSTISTTTQTPLVHSNDAIKVVTPGAYPYTTIPQDALIKVDTSAARTITPHASPVTGQKHIIKDTVGSAAANNITITPSGKNIDGAASYVMNVNYGSVTIVYNGTEWSIV